MNDDEVSIRMTSFVPVSTISRITQSKSKDDDDGENMSVLFSGIAHGYTSNLKHIILTKEAAKYAVKNFKKGLSKNKVYKSYIDHAYINFFNATPSEKIIGKVTDLRATDNGLEYTLDINSKHPSQIHVAMERGDIGGVSVGIDVNRNDVYCSECNRKIFSDDKCNHYIGMPLAGKSNKMVNGIVKKYEFVELSVTGEPADTTSSITMSFSNNIGEEIDLIALNKQKVETFKNDVNKTRDEDKMDNDNEQTEEYVTKEIFDTFKKEFTDSLKEQFSEMMVMQSNMIKEEKERLQKESIIDNITKYSKDFTEDELYTFDIETLKKLETLSTKAFNTTSNGTAHVQSSFQSDGQTDDEFTLSLEDIKAWTFQKMFGKPKVSDKIHRIVQARMRGEQTDDAEKFREYLMSKNIEIKDEVDMQ